MPRPWRGDSDASVLSAHLTNKEFQSRLLFYKYNIYTEFLLLYTLFGIYRYKPFSRRMPGHLTDPCSAFPPSLPMHSPFMI